MKTLLITVVAISTLFLAGCSNNPSPKTTEKTSSTTNEIIDESKEHGHNDKWESVATNDPKSMDTMKHDGMMWMTHATITSEEQFIAEMIPHHQEAVDTANIVIAKGENVQLRTIAQAIIDWQSKEISMLKGWLGNWYPSSTYKITYQKMMRPLESLKSHDLEDQFMEDMIKHHEWAIQMAKQVLEISQKPEIVKFANDVINAQSSEIAEFKKLLAAKDRH